MTDHPIAGTLTRISGLNLYVTAQLGLDDSGDWLPVMVLLGEDRPGVADLAARTAATYKTEDREALASFALNGYAWPLVMAALASLTLEARVPDVRLENICVRFSPAGYLAGMALQNPAFHTLPTDPDAGHPDAIVVPDRDALYETCRAAIETHMARVIAYVKHKLPWGENAMWLVVADRCAGALDFIFDQGLVGRERIEEAIDAILHRPGSRLYSPRTKIAWPEDDGEPALERASCCLAYRMPGSQYCTNCPLTRRAATPVSAA